MLRPVETPIYYSDNSIFKKSSNTHIPAKIRTNELKTFHKCHTISNRELLNLIYKKFTTYYQKQLMYQKQIRKEFYNDIDDCLENYATINNSCGQQINSNNNSSNIISNDKQKKISATKALANNPAVRATLSLRRQRTISADDTISDEKEDDDDAVKHNDETEDTTILQVNKLISERRGFSSSIKLQKITNADVVECGSIDGPDADLNYELDEIIIKFSLNPTDVTDIQIERENINLVEEEKEVPEDRINDSCVKMTVTCPATDEKICNFDESTWDDEREVELLREVNGSFGISIVGGKVNVYGDEVSGIFIKNIIPSSPADVCKQLKIGDRILAVCGNDIRQASHEDAVKTIKEAGERMLLVVQSLNNNKAKESSMLSVGFVKSKPAPVTPSTTPLPTLIQAGVDNGEHEDDDEPPEKTDSEKVVRHSDNSDYSSSDEEDTRDMEGKIFTKGGVEIDRASAGNVRRTKDEIAADKEEEDSFGYTKNKIKKRYGALGQINCHTLERGPNNCIGISLAGHRDRNKMACFIAGINPKGIASGKQIEVGDEILEVNGIVLHGRCHLNASAIIKGLPGPLLQFIVLHNKKAIDDIAVKPVTQFPVNIEENDEFSNFKNVRALTIKKGNQSLGIMIIEGKHAEVGQGIFVSDIQEGSNAEKAGLNIGDMLLAVNKDSLLGCNYETAASILKKSEGVVTLTVCNPNKKETLAAPSETGDKDNISMTKEIVPDKGPSRPITPKPQPSPAKEVVLDPSKCEILINENTTIDLNADKKPLGIFVVGGCDTLVNSGVVIVQIATDGAVDKDKRLKVFDQILEINGIKLTPELTGEQVQRAIKQLQTKVRFIVHRAEPSETETLDIELTKKPGKNLGLGFCVGNPKGVFVSDIIAGGTADLDGRIQRGDIVTHVNSDCISNLSMDECSSILKTAQGRITLKLLRAKPKKRAV